MAMTVNTNLAANNSQRHLGASNRALSKSLERLSSGLRINRAADDAAGLAIATKMFAQTRGLNQAVRNTNNAIALMQTAEGGVDAITNILQRLRELSVQASSDDNTPTDRANLKSESDNLVQELTRIATTTEYNTMQLTTGSFSGKYFQIGANYQQNITFSINDLRSKSLGKRAATELNLTDGANSGLNAKIDAEDVKINSTDIVTAGGDDQVSVLEIVGEELSVATFATSGATHASTTGAGGAATMTSLVASAYWKTVTGSGVSATTFVQIGTVTVSASAEAGGSIGTLMACYTVDGVGTTVSTTAVGGGGATTATLAMTLSLGTATFASIHVAGGSAGSIGTAVASFLAASDITGGMTFASSTGIQINATSVDFGTAMDLYYKGSMSSFVTKLVNAVNNASIQNVTARAWTSYTSTATVAGLVLSAKKGTDVSLYIATGASLGTLLGLSGTYFGGTGGGTTGTVTTYNGQTSAISKAAAVNLVKGTTTVEASVSTTTLTGTVNLGQMNLGSGDLYINGYDVGEVSGGSDSLIIAINSLSSYTGVTASLENGKLKLSASDGRNISVFTNGVADAALGLTAGTRTGNSDNVSRGGLTLNSKSNFTVSGNDYTKLGSNLEAKTYAANLNNNIGLIDLTTQSGAQNAILSIDAALDEVNKIRSEIGAIQNRLEFTVLNLESASENMSASDSRIRDADFAYETSRFTRNQILVQAGTAMLAQANTLPQTALQLLR